MGDFETTNRQTISNPRNPNSNWDNKRRVGRICKASGEGAIFRQKKNRRKRNAIKDAVGIFDYGVNQFRHSEIRMIAPMGNSIDFSEISKIKNVGMDEIRHRSPGRGG